MGTRTALKYAVAYLSVRARSESELKAYLSRKSCDEAEIESVTSTLKAEGLIDDSKTAGRWAAQLSETGKIGKDAAIRKMMLRGIPRDIARKSADEAWSGADEAEDAYRLLLRMYPRGFGEDDDEKASNRALRHLRSKGFSPEAILKAIRRMNPKE